MNKRFLILAALFGGLAVIAGAILAHSLKAIMPEAAREIYETAVRYQFYHVFALLACGILAENFPGTSIIRAGTFFILGILLFSGSLYIISALNTNGIRVPFSVGILTPAGGFCFMAGWAFLAASFRNRRTS
jgi:uncharacterized membrane protein YgdD (TMEM256/DUF423 family)